MPESHVPPFGGNINFNAQHAPIGAYFSFTCGRAGSRSGIAMQNARPNSDLYIGVKTGDRKSDSPIQCLPFFQPGADDADSRLVPYAERQIERHYGWASDRWVTPEFEFAIYSPFGEIIEPEKYHPSMSRVCLLPAVLATLTIDNSAGTETKTGLFAMNFNQRGAHLLTEQQGWRGKSARASRWAEMSAYRRRLIPSAAFRPKKSPLLSCATIRRKD